MTPLRLGAVSYLNTKPLVFGLEAVPDQFEVRFGKGKLVEFGWENPS